MRRIENHCVDCGLPCLENSCPYRNVSVYYCDECGEEGAEYRIDNDDLCGGCVEQRIKEAFNELTLSEKAKAVDINLNEINN